MEPSVLFLSVCVLMIMRCDELGSAVCTPRLPMNSSSSITEGIGFLLFSLPVTVLNGSRQPSRIAKSGVGTFEVQHKMKGGILFCISMSTIEIVRFAVQWLGTI